MASSPEVVKKVMRFKQQLLTLTDTTESVTLLKILQKLKDLDITFEILAETGIGKTVNSLRRHEEAGEFAKSLVRGWKRLVHKEPTSHTEDGDASESLSVKDELNDQNSPNNGGLTKEDLNNYCLPSHGTSQDSTDMVLFKTGNRKAESERQCEEQISQKDQHVNQGKSPQEKHNVSHNDILKKKIEIQVDEMDDSVVSKEKKNRKSGDGVNLLGDRNTEDTRKKSSLDLREKTKSHSDSVRLGSVRESKKKSKPSKESFKEGKESLSFESSDKYSKTLKQASVTDDGSSGISARSPEAQSRKMAKTYEVKHVDLKCKDESENKGSSKHRKVKMKCKDKERGRFPEEPSMSFESSLNYDVNVSKRKRSGVRKTPKKLKTEVEGATKDPAGTRALKSPATGGNAESPKQLKDAVMDLMNIPLAAVLPQCEEPFSVECLDRKAEKDSDPCEVSEESAGFTGQRLNRKMQVYSGAKTIFLPSMMSLHQQCIRTLQNNINLLYETGGVPFEILEPVLERCTSEQLLRVEEYNPIYIGVTDHLWGKHCERDFKHYRLQEYESWKEMYVRLSEERERKLQRLTKTIVSAHSKKPKGRQVKMAFIHTVAKPPRDVRIQQEIHGTAVQQPQLRCSVKVQDNRPRPSCNEPSRSSSIASVAGNTQDPRKKTRVAPMMAKSLKAFKTHLGRR